jgi:hypothetical protein
MVIVIHREGHFREAERNAASTLAATMTLRHMATLSGGIPALKHSLKRKHIMSVAD